MKPDVLMHFADRIAMIGVYEGLWHRPGNKSADPDGLLVRLDDGTRAVVVGSCDGMYLAELARHTDEGWPILRAVHRHRNDTLTWWSTRDDMYVESCGAART